MKARRIPVSSIIAAVGAKPTSRSGVGRIMLSWRSSYVITGRYDSPYTQLSLTARDNAGGEEYWWGADQLNAMRLVDGQYFTTSTDPLGDKLTVKPYQGDFGVLKIGAGNRTLSRVSRFKARSRRRDTRAGRGNAGRCDLPVLCCRSPNAACPSVTTSPITSRSNTGTCGSASPRTITVTASCGTSIAARGPTASRSARMKPFVWDFSDPPEVLFASPAKDQTYKRGDEIEVEAVLTDPKLTIMIRGLADTDRKEHEDDRPGRWPDEQLRDRSFPRSRR